MKYYQLREIFKKHFLATQINISKIFLPFFLTFGRKYYINLKTANIAILKTYKNINSSYTRTYTCMYCTCLDK